MGWIEFLMDRMQEGKRTQEREEALAYALIKQGGVGPTSPELGIIQDIADRYDNNILKKYVQGEGGNVQKREEAAARTASFNQGLDQVIGAQMGLPGFSGGGGGGNGGGMGGGASRQQQPQSQLPIQPPSTIQPQSTPQKSGSRDFNMGNIRASATDFRTYSSPEEGVADAVSLLRRGYRNMSLREIGNKWAPPSENDTEAWVRNVSTASGLPPDAIPDLDNPQQIQSLLHGIMTAEKSPKQRNMFTPEVMGRGIQLAGGMQQGQGVMMSQGQQNPQQGQQQMSPALQAIPEISELPPMQQGMSEAALRSLSLSRNANGSWNLNFQPFASETVDQQLGAFLTQQTPKFRRAFNTMLLMSKAGLAPQMQFRNNEVTGNGEFVYVDPFMMQQWVMPVGKVKMTPEEQQKMEIDTAGKKAAVTEIGQERGKQAISPEKVQRENEEFYGKVKETPESTIEDLGGTIGSVKSIGKTMRNLARYTGTDAEGALIPERVPTGLGETISQTMQKRFGVGTEMTGVMREQLTGLSTAVRQILYNISGKQVSDAELKALEALDQSINLDPRIYLTRLANVQELIQNRAEGLKEAYSVGGRDVRSIDALLKALEDNDIVKLLPKQYRRALGRDEGDGGETLPNLDDLYNNTIQGKGKK